MARLSWTLRSEVRPTETGAETVWIVERAGSSITYTDEQRARAMLALLQPPGHEDGDDA